MAAPEWVRAPVAVALGHCEALHLPRLQVVMGRLGRVVLVALQRIKWQSMYELWSKVYSWATILIPPVLTAPRCVALLQPPERRLGVCRLPRSTGTLCLADHPHAPAARCRHAGGHLA
jgi:hypothetical protein